MLSAIFAVLLLGRYVASEIYVGQNPLSVNAVVRDANGKLVDVTGTEDTITILDLQFGDEPDNATNGMSVDISVTPLNATSPDFESGFGEPDFGTDLVETSLEGPDIASYLDEPGFESDEESDFGIPSTVEDNSNWIAPAKNFSSSASSLDSGLSAPTTNFSSPASSFGSGSGFSAPGSSDFNFSSPGSDFNFSSPGSDFNFSSPTKNFNSSASSLGSGSGLSAPGSDINFSKPATNLSNASASSLFSGFSTPANISNFFDSGLSSGTNKSDSSAIESMPKDPFGPDNFDEVPYITPSMPANIKNASAPSAPSYSNITNLGNITTPFLPNITGITSPIGTPGNSSSVPVIPFPDSTSGLPVGYPGLGPKSTASNKRTRPLPNVPPGTPPEKNPFVNFLSNQRNKTSQKTKPANIASPFGSFLEIAGEVGPPVDPNSSVPIAEQVERNLDPDSDFLDYDDSPQNLGDGVIIDVGPPDFGNSDPSDMMDPLRYVSQVLPPATDDSTNITDHSDATSFLINSLLKSINSNPSPLNWLGGNQGMTNLASLFQNPMNNVPSAEDFDETDPAKQKLMDLLGPDVDFVEVSPLPAPSPAPSFGGMSNLLAPLLGNSMNGKNNSNPFGNLLSSFLGSGMLGSSGASGSLSNIVQSMLGALSSNITSFMAEVFEVPSGLNGTNSWNFTGVLLPMADNNATMSSMSEILSSIFGQPFSFNASTPWKTDNETLPMFGFSFNYGNDTFNSTNPLNFTLLDPSGPLSPMISSFMNSSFSNISGLMSDMNKAFMGNMSSSMGDVISMVSSLMKTVSTLAQNTSSKQTNDTMNQIYQGMDAVKKSMKTMKNSLDSPKPCMLPSALPRSRQSFGVAPDSSGFQTLLQPDDSLSSNDMKSSVPESEFGEPVDGNVKYFDESPESDNNSSTLAGGSFNATADSLTISNATSASGNKTAESSSAGKPMSSIWLLFIGVVAIFGRKKFI